MNIANKISAFRILSVPVFISILVYYTPLRDYLRWMALAVFLLAVVSDAFDGFIARKTKQYTQAGMVLDPLGDKLLLMSAFVMLYLRGDFPARISFPLWVVLVVISRDVIILLGVVVVYMVKQQINISPTRWGKLTTLLQMLSVIFVLLQWRSAEILWYMAAGFTIISGVDYIRRGAKALYAMDNYRSGV